MSNDSSNESESNKNCIFMGIVKIRKFCYIEKYV